MQVDSTTQQEKHTQNDPWLSVLLWLVQHFELRHHPLKLISGIPLEDGKLNSDLFIRMAERADLELTLVELHSARNASFPLVVATRSQVPCIVTGYDTEGFHVQSFNDDQIRTELLSERDLLIQFNQQAWQVSANTYTDERVDSLHRKKPEHWLFPVVKEMRPWYRDLLIASLMINILALIVPLFTMNVYDRVVPNQAFNTLWVLVVGMSLVVVFDWLLRKARGIVTDSAGKYIDNKLSAQLFSKVMGMKLEHRPQSIGAFSRQLQDFDSVRDFFTSASLVAVVDLPFTALFLLLIGWLGGPMMAIPITVMFLLLLLSSAMKSKIEKTHTETATLSTQRQAHLFDCLSSITELKQNNATGNAQKRWENTVSALSDWQNLSRHYSNVVAYSIQSSQQIITIALIVTGVYRIAEGQLSMGGLIAIVMLSGRAASAVNQIAILLLRYQQTKTAVEGLNSIIELPQETNRSQVITNGDFQGAFRLEDVSFQYPSSPVESVKNISINVTKGERIGIVGNAGAGKSTLLSLITHQLSPTQGTIYFDNIDSHLWPVDLLRSHTGWVGQNPQLVYGSIIENIVLGYSVVDQTRLQKVVELSGLNHHMTRLSQGMETQVGEGGRFLSGGQRQAVALARALYRQPSMLVMDEPTNNLDRNAEAVLFNSLQNMPKDITLIISSHKHSFLALCHRIIVLDQGKVVSDGTAKDILSQQAAGNSSNRIRAVSIVREGGKG